MSPSPERLSDHDIAWELSADLRNNPSVFDPADLAIAALEEACSGVADTRVHRPANARLQRVHGGGEAEASSRLEHSRDVGTLSGTARGKAPRRQSRPGIPAAADVGCNSARVTQQTTGRRIPERRD